MAPRQPHPPRGPETYDLRRDHDQRNEGKLPDLWHSTVTREYARAGWCTDELPSDPAGSDDATADAGGGL